MLSFALPHAMRVLPVHHHTKLFSRVRFAAMALLIALVGVLFSTHILWAQSAIVEDYFVPLPEEQLFASFDAINSVSGPPVVTRVSIAIGGPTIIYYDQWENGYEAVINAPTNLFSSGGPACPPENLGGTQIWGNSNVCDGTPPNFASDKLDNGDVVILQSAVPIPRLASEIRYDGGDKLASTYPIAVTKTAYPSNPGTVLAGGTEVLKTGQWGTQYRAPLGQNVASVTNAWEYSRLYVMAANNGTEIFKNGVSQGVLQQGKSLVIAVNVNDLITSNKPIQVDLITGDIDSSYEMRWDSVAPLEAWASEYFMPVGQKAGSSTYKVVVWLYNPNQSSSITVNWEIGGATGSTVVPAKQAVASPGVGGSDGRYGSRFFTQNGAPFYATAQIDAINGGELYDWGFPLIAGDLLSPQVLVGDGLGCTEPGKVINSKTCTLGNVTNARSFVWVMPTSGTNVPIYVAYDGRAPVCPATSANYNETFTLNALRIRTVQQASDLDMTGARIWTCAPGVQLAVAWGQDPERSFSGDDQGLDLGTVVFPLPSIQLEKSSAFSGDNDEDNTISPGDEIIFTIAIVNNGAFPATIVVADSLPAGMTYNPGTTQYHKANGTVVPVPDNTLPSTPFPLDEGGLSTLQGNPIVVQPGNAESVTYEVTINPNTDCTLTLINRATVIGTVSATNSTVNGSSDEVTVLTCSPGIDVKKFTNSQDANTPTGPFINTGGPVQWTYIVTNIGDVALENVTLNDDILGPITSGCVPAIPAVLAKGASFTCTVNGTAEAGQYANVATVNANAITSDALTVSDSDPSHYFGQSPKIDIEKYTNSDPVSRLVDADIPQGPFVFTGEPVTWTYIVVNTGNVTLTNVTVTDNQIGAVTCPQNVLAPGASMICIETGIADVGQYFNMSTVVGTPPAGSNVTDSDPSHYFGVDPSLVIKKYTNDEDADIAPGATITVGDAVIWTYLVTNTGNVPLAITVTDDQGVPVACPRSIIPPGGTMQCTAHGIATAGQYANIGTASANFMGRQVTDDDPSHYFGVADPSPEPRLRVIKLTNGNNADLPPGPIIQVGDPVTWTYLILNISQITLTNVSLTDDQLSPPPVVCPDDEIGPLDFMICQVTDIAVAGQYSNTARVEGTTPTSVVLSDTDPSHYFGALPGIEVKKYTNGEDANTPIGPIIVEGETVTWTYVVTNTGNVDLQNITVTDDQGVPVTCPSTGLGAGESMTCLGNTGVAEVGQYSNIATVAGVPPVGEVVTNTDPSHYFGEPLLEAEQTLIAIKKYTNGEDADEVPGPLVAPNSTVNWTYEITNTGPVSLTNVQVTDDQGVSVSCPKSILAAGEHMTCTAQGLAIIGQYTNTGTAVGLTPGQQQVTASDPSHYFGSQPGISLTKYTNGEDADTPTGPYILSGSTVRWNYVLTNIGNVAITSFSIVDSVQGAVTCPRIGLIAPGESVLCFLDGIAQVGQYANNSTVTATSIDGRGLTDSNPSHYFGAVASIDLEKHTNGEDADTPPGPSIEIGDQVVWSYIVTNTSNVALTEVTITDDPLGAVTCPKTTLAPGESMTCTLEGIAIAEQYTNTADVFAIPAVGVEVVDSDPSHYFGIDPTALPEEEQPHQSRDIFLPFVNSKEDGE